MGVLRPVVQILRLAMLHTVHQPSVGHSFRKNLLRSGGSRLGFALLLKYFTLLGRFPTGRPELAEEAVGFVACQVRVQASELLGARQRNADEADRRGLTPLF
jgi:hypothetical protein